LGATAKLHLFFAISQNFSKKKKKKKKIKIFGQNIHFLFFFPQPQRIKHCHSVGGHAQPGLDLVKARLLLDSEQKKPSSKKFFFVASRFFFFSFFFHPSLIFPFEIFLDEQTSA
jgi:hypothetical protein